MIYPLDYGYLEGTDGGDGEGIDVWLGTQDGPGRVVGALATADHGKRDMELKLLIDCSEEDIRVIVAFLESNQMGLLHLVCS